MSRKASYCDECKHFTATPGNTKDVCAVGHRPRFYAPQSMSHAHTDDWGWKRRCEDYKKARSQQ